MKTYWAIEDKNGILVTGHYDVPLIYRTKRGALEDCEIPNERPVKVEVRKVEE